VQIFFTCRSLACVYLVFRRRVEWATWVMAVDMILCGGLSFFVFKPVGGMGVSYGKWRRESSITVGDTSL
jgi:hypothetical protein